MKGRIRTICQPVEFSIRTFKRREEQILVITAEANDGVGRPLLETNQEVNDASAVRSTIDVIAQENEACLVRRGVFLAELEKSLKLLEAAMNIADGVGLGRHNTGIFADRIG
jgi:hypothetical protein